MQFLGHMNTNHTLKYIQLEEALFKNENEEYLCKVATTVKEAQLYIEKGYEYVCNFNEEKMFRKRK